MATNRGLPPPSAMTLPSPTQSSSLGQLPDRWSHGTEETQRTWLQAKMEEERRKQEEERRRQEEQRTQQENIRLEVRRTELEMLREAFRGGMPAQLVPVIFTGGGAMAGSSAEWASQYMAQMHQNQQQIQSSSSSMVSPEMRRNSRLLAATEYQTPQPSTLSGIPRGPPPPPPPPSMPPHQQSIQHHPNHHHQPPPPPPPPPPGYSPYHMSPARPPSHQHHSITHPDSSHRSTLPRINTNEMDIPPAPQGPPGLHMGRQNPPPPPMPPMQHPSPSQGPPLSMEAQRHQQRDQQESSPSIFFHHWQPPGSQGNSSAAPAQSTSPQTSKPLDSPFSQQQQTQHMSAQDTSSSPKKRKMGGGQSGSNQSGMSGSQQGITFSPSYSSGSSSQGANRRRGHTRNRSDSGAMRGYEPYPRTSTRQRRSDAGPADYGDSRYGSSSHFSINHLTTQDESPELRHREHTHPSSSQESQPSQQQQQPYSAGSEMRGDAPAYLKREGGNIDPGPGGSGRN